jgi:uncharacterized repeat protein (TIGR01451 family)
MNVQTISYTAFPRRRGRPLTCVCLAGLFIALLAAATQSGWTSTSTLSQSQSAASIAQQVKPGQVPDGPTANEWDTIQSAVQAAPLSRPLLAPGDPVTNPTGNTHTAPPTTTVSITYDETISPTTVSTRTFAVFASQTGLLTQTYGVVSGTIMLTPTVPFKPGELVQVSATTSTLNMNGEGPTSPTVWQFWVGVDGGSGVFAPHPTAPTFGGGSRAAVALGDVDDDGDLDAVDASNGAEHVYLNDGTGQFAPHPIGPTFGGGWTSYDLDLGDVDGDGDLDAVVAGTPHRVYLNEGAGLLFPHPSVPTFGGGYSVNLGDVDGDSDLDVVSSIYGEYYVYLNDGTGQFTPHPVSPGFGTGDSSSDLALGDVDDDGDLDAIVAQTGSLPQKVYLNDGTGQFTPHPTAPTFGAGNSTAVALGDVDEDGDLDAVVGNSDSALALYLNDGMGQFSLHPSNPIFGSSGGQKVILGDMDGDGGLDAIVSYGTGSVSIYRNDGTGQFNSYSSFLSSSAIMTLGDVDSDGDVDIVIVNGGYSPNETWLNRNAVDLDITKSVVPTGTLGRSDALTYTLTYSNAGAQIASGVVITDLVPITVTDVRFVSSGASVTPTGSISYTWQVQDLAPGTGGTITVYGRISPMATGLFTLTNRVTITATEVDTNAGNNWAIVQNNVDVEPPSTPTLYHPNFAKNYYGYSSTLYLQNAAPTATMVLLSFYDLTGGSGTISVSHTIPARGTMIMPSDSVEELADGQRYSLITSADQSIESSVHTHAPPSFSDRLAIYQGQRGGSTIQYFAPFFGGDETLTSTLSLWNVSASDANLATVFYDRYGTLASAWDYTVLPGEQIFILDPGLPAGFLGSVIVTSDQPMIGLLTLSDQNGETLEHYGALSTGDAQVFMPRALKAVDEGEGPRTTTLFVVNTSAAQTDVTMSFYDSAGTLGLTTTFKLPAHGSWQVDLGSEGNLSDGSLWSVVVSADQPLAIGELTSYDAAPFHANGAYACEIGTILKLPGIIRRNDVHTDFSIQNTGIVAATVAVDYYDASGNLVSSQVETLPAMGWARHDQSQMPELGSSFEGSVVIRSDRPVIALNEMVAYSAETGPTSIYLPLVVRNYDSRLPYFDDFSDPGSGWYIGDSMGDVSFSYQDGEYEILLGNADWWWDGMLPPLGCVTNYSVEADMRRYSGNTTQYGLTFGLEDWDHLYIFIVEPGYQYYSVWRRTFPSAPYWVPLIDWTPSSYINPSNATNHLKVEHSGSQITVYVNDQFLGTVGDGAYTGCLQVGLYAGTDPAYPDVPATVRYDNFQVR